jgi:hypothetical protein
MNHASLKVRHKLGAAIVDLQGSQGFGTLEQTIRELMESGSRRILINCAAIQTGESPCNEVLAQDLLLRVRATAIVQTAPGSEYFFG